MTDIAALFARHKYELVSETVAFRSAAENGTLGDFSEIGFLAHLMLTLMEKPADSNRPLAKGDKVLISGRSHYDNNIGNGKIGKVNNPNHITAEGSLSVTVDVGTGDNLLTCIYRPDQLTRV